MKWPLITGPTASGKTGLSLELAESLHAPILACDAMQVYQGMNIGTAKPTLAEQNRVLHGMIDVVPIDQRFTVGQWYQGAERFLAPYLEARSSVVACGGTPQYVTALIEGHIPGVMPESLALRAEIERHASATPEGWIELHEALRQFDPLKYKKLHPNDHRRVVRAHEVFRLSGRSQSDWEEGETVETRYPFVAFAIEWPRDALYERINHRVDQMMDEGLLEEVRALKLHEINAHVTAKQAIGYKEIFAYLAGEASLKDAVELIKQNTRRYAKRQLTWFRAKPWIHWLKLSDKDNWMEYILEKCR